MYFQYFLILCKKSHLWKTQKWDLIFISYWVLQRLFLVVNLPLWILFSTPFLHHSCGELHKFIWSYIFAAFWKTLNPSGFMGFSWRFKDLWKKACEQRYLISYMFILLIVPYVARDYFRFRISFQLVGQLPI